MLWMCPLIYLTRNFYPWKKPFLMETLHTMISWYIHMRRKIHFNVQNTFLKVGSGAAWNTAPGTFEFPIHSTWDYQMLYLSKDFVSSSTLSVIPLVYWTKGMVRCLYYSTRSVSNCGKHKHRNQMVIIGASKVTFST